MIRRECGDSKLWPRKLVCEWGWVWGGSKFFSVFVTKKIGCDKRHNLWKPPNRLCVSSYCFLGKNRKILGFSLRLVHSYGDIKCEFRCERVDTTLPLTTPPKNFQTIFTLSAFHENLEGVYRTRSEWGQKLFRYDAKKTLENQHMMQDSKKWEKIPPNAKLAKRNKTNSVQSQQKATQ